MSNASPVTVLIAGAGPVGLTMACELARYGIPCRIVDQKPAPSTTSRALAIFPRTLEVFELMGVLEGALQRGHKLDGLSVSDGKKALAEIDFSHLPSRYPFALSLPQSETERLLIERLATFGVAVEWGTALEGYRQHEDAVEARLCPASAAASGGLPPAELEETLEIPWLLGCDGAHSTTRHLLGIGFEGHPYDESFLLADVALSSSLAENRAHAFFSDDGLLAFFPFGHGRCRVIAQVPANSEDPASPAAALAEVQELVARRTHLPARVSDAVWTSRFHISARKVAQFRHGRVFLAGDAAHIHSPAGGQGMNTGIQDAFNLAWKLAFVIRRQAPESLLDSYHAEREPVACGVLRFTDRLTHFATTHSAFLRRLRGIVIPTLAGLGPIREKITGRLAELAIAYRGSPIVSGRCGRLHAGDRMSDFAFQEPGTGQAIRLYPFLASARTPVLLILGADAEKTAARCTALQREIDEQFAGLVVTRAILPSAPEPAARPALLDPEGLLRKTASLPPAGLILIRPDGYLGYCSEDLELSPLRKTLATFAIRQLGVAAG